MANTYKIKKGRYYYATDNGRVEEVEAQDVKVDGVSYELHKELYKTLDEKHQRLQEYVDTSIFALREFLMYNGIITPNDDLKSLINDLKSVKTIVGGVEYLNFTLNTDGYIVGFSPFNSMGNELLEVLELPQDVTNGCYYIEDGKLIKDEQKLDEMWSVI